MEFIFYFFGIGIVISGVMVLSSLNPVYSVFWLIIAFINTSIIFILIDVDFVALIFLIIYVGAIAILFLFVVMMLNIINYERGVDMSNYLPIGLIIGVIFFMISYNTIWENKFLFIQVDKFDSIINYSNIQELGRILYTDCYYYFIIASFILLVAMLGAIILVKETKIKKKDQDIYIQINRELWLL